MKRKTEADQLRPDPEPISRMQNIFADIGLLARRPFAADVLKNTRIAREADNMLNEIRARFIMETGRSHAAANRHVDRICRLAQTGVLSPLRLNELWLRRNRGEFKTLPLRKIAWNLLQAGLI